MQLMTDNAWINTEFKRKFSLSMYKNLKIFLGEMSFSKDFTKDTHGNLYPMISKSEDCTETVKHHAYFVTQGKAKRLICQFFPYATYEVEASVTAGSVGFCFRLPHTEVTILKENRKLIFLSEDKTREAALPDFVGDIFSMVISCRPGAFDVYIKHNEKPEFICTFVEESFSNSNQFQIFSNSYAMLTVSGKACVRQVLSYMDNGVSVADIKAIKYENGETMVSEGKAYLTASVRMQAGAFQGVFSWIPGTAEFHMTGALFFDCGDGTWRNYLASSILYHREKKQWYVWTSSFEHEHILACAAFYGDPRFGVNVVDVRLMKKASASDDITAFVGFVGDEDPDFFYDIKTSKWLMAICRKNPETKQYGYVFFASDEPLEGYACIGKGTDGAETGGSFVKTPKDLFFVCGNSFRATSEYRIYSKDGMKKAMFNYPDGGFRGWGTILPIALGSRTRYFWLTFDRQKGSDYTWSYGNLYCFEAESSAND